MPSPIFRNKPAEPHQGIGNRAVIDGDDLAQVLGVEPGGDLGRPD